MVVDSASALSHLSPHTIIKCGYQSQKGVSNGTRNALLLFLLFSNQLHMKMKWTSILYESICLLLIEPRKLGFMHENRRLLPTLFDPIDQKKAPQVPYR